MGEEELADMGLQLLDGTRGIALVHFARERLLPFASLTLGFMACHGWEKSAGMGAVYLGLDKIMVVIERNLN